MLPGYFRNAIVHHSHLFLVRQTCIERQHVGDMRVRVRRGQFPAYLDDGPVYLDTEEVLRFAGDREGCAERDFTVDVRHGRLADEHIAVPGPAVFPREAVGRPAVLHDGRQAVVVIGRHAVATGRFLPGSLVVLLLFPPCCQFAFQFLYLFPVGIVLLAVSGGILHARPGDFLQQVFVLSFQGGDLRFQRGHPAVRLLYLGVEFREVQLVLRDGGLHDTFF